MTEQDVKKFLIELHAPILYQIILQRYQTLTTISTICFIIVGIMISFRADIVHNQILAYVSAVLFLVIAFLSFDFHLKFLRRSHDFLSKSIKELPDRDFKKELQETDGSTVGALGALPPELLDKLEDSLPEFLFQLLIANTLLFILSLL